MADNLLISTAGGNETVGTDQISSVHYQRTKLISGANDTNDGDVQRANASQIGPLPVNAYLASDFIIVAGLGLTPKFKSISISAEADTSIVPGVSNKKIRVLAFVFSKIDAGEIQFETNAAGGTALTGTIEVVAATPFILPFNPVGWFQTISDGDLLNLALTTGTATGAGCLTYIEV